MGRFNIRTQVTEILGQLVPRILAMAHVEPRLSKFIQRIPWLADLPANHPRITKVVIYWLVAAPMAFVLMLIQGAQTMAAALLHGGFLQVLQALAWLVVYSVTLGGAFVPIWLLQHIDELLGPLSGLLVFGLVLFGAWQVLFLWLDLPTAAIRGHGTRHARAQGRLSDAEILKKLGLGASTKIGDIDVVTGVIPLGYVADKPIGIPWTADAGHMAVVGPTRSGKGLHLTDTLIRWPGPVVCIDPKGEQWQRTAGFRQQAHGPVFPIPPQGLDLAELYDLNQDLDVRELHETLLRPWQDGNDRIFADKALPLFTAAVKYGKATGEHPLAVLGRWAQDSPVNASSVAACGTSSRTVELQSFAGCHSCLARLRRWSRRLPKPQRFRHPASRRKRERSGELSRDERCSA
jgi:hypothetical protein